MAGSPTATYRNVTAVDGPEAARLFRELRTANRHCLTWLYAIQAGGGGPIKIGISDDPAKRLVALQTAHYDTLWPIATWRGAVEEERWIHEDLFASRIRGEWFEADKEIVYWLQSIGHAYGDWAERYSAKKRNTPRTYDREGVR